MSDGFSLDAGDSAVYVQCDDPDCPDVRPGTNHAHAERVERADGTVEKRPPERKDQQ